MGGNGRDRKRHKDSQKNNKAKRFEKSSQSLVFDETSGQEPFDFISQYTPHTSRSRCSLKTKKKRVEGGFPTVLEILHTYTF